MDTAPLFGLLRLGQRALRLGPVLGAAGSHPLLAGCTGPVTACVGRCWGLCPCFRAAAAGRMAATPQDSEALDALEAGRRSFLAVLLAL